MRHCPCLFAVFFRYFFNSRLTFNGFVYIFNIIVYNIVNFSTFNTVNFFNTWDIRLIFFCGFDFLWLWRVFNFFKCLVGCCALCRYRLIFGLCLRFGFGLLNKTTIFFVIYSVSVNLLRPLA